jgi:hypothetical protein
MIPTQGRDTPAFESVAVKLNSDVYKGKATIVKTTIVDSGGSFSVTFTKRGGGTFSWGDEKDLASVLMISHGFSCDGPNLAYHDPNVPDAGHQPWGSGTSCSLLSPYAASFWGSVGPTISASGKIILVGCFMGSGDYAKLVATASGRSVYASKTTFGAGDAAVAIPYVRDIEKGVVRSPMQRFDP